MTDINQTGKQQIGSPRSLSDMVGPESVLSSDQSSNRRAFQKTDLVVFISKNGKLSSAQIYISVASGQPFALWENTLYSAEGLVDRSEIQQTVGSR